MKNFFDYKDEKINDKAFSQGLIISVVSILLCIIALASSSWAWFSKSVSSPPNIIKASTYSLEIEIKADDGAIISGVENEGNYKSYKYSLELEKEYTVTLTADEASSGNGYCKIIVDGIEQPYYTSAVSSNTSGELNNPCKFSFKVKSDAQTSDAQTVDVTFELRWGIYSGDANVSDNGELECDMPSQNN